MVSDKEYHMSSNSDSSFYVEADILNSLLPTQVLSCKICNYFEENLCMSTCKLYLKRDSKIGVCFRTLWII